MAKAVSGIRKWFPTVASSIGSEQLGFDIGSCGSLFVGAFNYIQVDEDYIWTSIQNINTHNIEIQAKKADDISGDDLAKNGIFSLTGGGLSNLHWLTMYPEDVIYGRFKVVTIKKPASGTDYLRMVRSVRK
jgi:hypothetical protein